MMSQSQGASLEYQKRVFLICTAEPSARVLWDDYYFIRESLDEESSGRYIAVDDPDNADLICFVSAQYDDLRDVIRHPIYKRYHQKAVTIQTRDDVYARLPGVYASVSRFESRFLQVFSGCYPRVSTGDYRWSGDEELNYLFSFVGSFRTASLRKQLGKIVDPRCLIVNTDETSAGPWVSRYTSAHRIDYCRIVEQSKFVLCPRGRGLSSMRLFETLAAGRVPVVISDRFAMPPGPDWSACSVQVKEKDIKNLPEILRHYEGTWESMRQCAHQVWLKWYDKPVAIDVLLDHCVDSQERWKPLKGRLIYRWKQLSGRYIVRVFLPDVVQVLVRIKHKMGIQFSILGRFRH